MVLGRTTAALKDIKASEEKESDEKLSYQKSVRRLNSKLQGAHPSIRAQRDNQSQDMCQHCPQTSKERQMVHEENAQRPCSGTS